MDYLLKNTELKPINETFESILKDIDKKKPLNEMRVLEIGIGTGIYSIPIEKKFKSYYGIEPLKKIYDVLIELKKTHNSYIKCFNMSLEEFVHKNTVNATSSKLFDIVILKNVIHFIGYDDVIKHCRKIVKKNAFIIIQNAQAKPIGWGNSELVKDSINFNENKWLGFKNKLEICFNSLLNSKYLDKYEKDNKYVFFVLYSDDYFN